MIVLDTNVVSEPLKLKPDPVVLSWLRRQVPTTLFLSSPGLAEMLAGIATMPEGQKKQALADNVNNLTRSRFSGRILPFDERAASIYGGFAADTRRSGRTISIIDAQIASVAAANGFAVATRDIHPFVAVRVSTINPWLNQG